MPGDASVLSQGFVAELTRARRQLSHTAWQEVAQRVSGLNTVPDGASVREATAGLVNHDAAWILSQAILAAGQVTWPQIAGAMAAVDYAVGDGRATTEIVWTGPDSSRFPMRRIDQMLYDLVISARRRIVLVTYAAYKVPHLVDRLADAVSRGVELMLIVESKADSNGQLTFDAAQAFRGVPAVLDRLYYWPIEKRPRNQAGSPGKLHAKCAIVDDVALIGSANFTDDAFNRNMEMGVLLKEPAVVATIAEHYRELIRTGNLARVG